jgi:hypothetical protein
MMFTQCLSSTAREKYSMEEKTYSIYQYAHPHTGKSLYIGLTSNPRQRFLQHISSSSPLSSIIRDLNWQGIEVTPTILETTNDYEEAKQLEKRWIQTNTPLLNQVHNQEEIKRRKREEEITFWMKDKGWTHKEASLFLEDFWDTGDMSFTYDAIAYGAQAAREILGIEGEFTSSEILHMALRYRGFEK